MSARKVERHTVSVYPPNPWRKTYLAICSCGEFNQSFLNRVTVMIEANKHYTDLMVVSELEQGTYLFDDGRT
jgi:hypothetical protein